MLMVNDGKGEQTSPLQDNGITVGAGSARPTTDINNTEGHMQYAPTNPQLKDRRGVLHMPNNNDINNLPSTTDHYEIQNIIEIALPLLPLKHRKVIELRVYENKSWEEIGKIMRISKSAAEGRYYRIEKKIKRLEVMLEQYYKGGGIKEIKQIANRWHDLCFKY